MSVSVLTAILQLRVLSLIKHITNNGDGYILLASACMVYESIFQECCKSHLFKKVLGNWRDMFWKESYRLCFYSLVQVTSWFQSECFWLLYGHCDSRCNSSLDSLQLFGRRQVNEFDLVLILPWGPLLGLWWGQPRNDLWHRRRGKVQQEARRECWMPASLFHISERLLLTISRN